MSTISYRANQTLHPVAGKAYNYYGRHPLLTGDVAPAFYLQNNQVIANQFSLGVLPTGTTITLQDLLDYRQPLVITFISSIKEVEQIKVLESLQADIQVMGGRLIVFTHTPLRIVHKLISRENTLNIFYDHEQQIAELFGLYDAENPLWEWLSGVDDEEEALPAFYVLSQDRRIAYHHIDYRFSLNALGKYFGEQHFLRKLLTSVYDLSQLQEKILYASYKEVV